MPGWSTTARWLFLLGLVGNTGCGGEVPREDPPHTTLFDPGVTEIVVEVDYETGAAPILEPRRPGGRPWQVALSSFEALFDGSGITISLPETPTDAEDLGAIDGDDYTADDLVALNASRRDTNDTTTRRVVYVLLLDGYYSDGERRDNIMGVAISGENLIAIFKPVLPAEGNLARFAEQATLVHEFGHLAGLVNNGLPLTSDHHDAANGAHCTNSDCVMHHLNEGRSEMMDFVDRLAMGPEQVVLFDAACLSDARGLER